MKLFHWNRLKTCENHSTGDGIVMAEDLDQARITLREALCVWCAENREYLWVYGDAEDRAELEAKVDADVAQEPDMVSDIAVGVIVRGSE